MDGKCPMTTLKITCSCQRIDKLMGLDALSALDQAATKYIESSEAMKAATPAPPRGTSLDISRADLSALRCACLQGNAVEWITERA